MINTKYRQKAKDSFKTRLNLYLFDRVLRDDPIDTITTSEFEEFKLSHNLINLYTTEYHQLDYDKYVGNKMVNEIWQKMTLWRKQHQDIIDVLQNHYVEVIFPSIFSKAEFADLINASEPQCHYCGITTDKIKILINKRRLYKKRSRGFQLEIDRKKPNEEYTPENSVLCCYWCNNAKTDEFFDEEFMEVGNAIRKIWSKRLST